MDKCFSLLIDFPHYIATVNEGCKSPDQLQKEKMLGSLELFQLCFLRFTRSSRRDLCSVAVEKEVCRSGYSYCHMGLAQRGLGCEVSKTRKCLEFNPLFLVSVCGTGCYSASHFCILCPRIQCFVFLLKTEWYCKQALLWICKVWVLTALESALTFCTVLLSWLSLQ